jgi:alpha-1,2-glucosyltransferase
VICSVKTLSRPKHMLSLVQALAPFVTIAVCFVVFVIWNGSVVLGDKSNHVATLHLPQMLYIWPFMTFFSWPVLYPYLLLMPISMLAWLPLSVMSLESFQMFKRGSLLPRLWLAVIAIGLVCTAVYGNTVVHPFTTADNRHYIFYVFRLLLRPWWVRYAVAPVYILCGWACFQALGAGPPAINALDKKHKSIEPKLPLPDSQHSATVSFALIWTATSALQLITAPLVEPRYFILPWLFWRIHLPLRLPSSTDPESVASPLARFWHNVWEDYDHRLWLETVWLLLVNAGAGYMFLYRGFQWPQEPGMVQRFMW